MKLSCSEAVRHYPFLGRFFQRPEVETADIKLEDISPDVLDLRPYVCVLSIEGDIAHTEDTIAMLFDKDCQYLGIATPATVSEHNMDVKKQKTIMAGGEKIWQAIERFSQAGSNATLLLVYSALTDKSRSTKDTPRENITAVSIYAPPPNESFMDLIGANRASLRPVGFFE